MSCGLDTNGSATISEPVQSIARGDAKRQTLARWTIGYAWFLTLLWTLRAFTPAYKLSTVVLAALLAWLMTGLLVTPLARGLARAGRARPLERVAWTAISPALLFTAYLPEYLLGGAVSAVRSGILLALTLGLCVCLWQLSSPDRLLEAKLAGTRRVRRFRVLFGCGLLAYFTAVTILSLRKLAVLGYAGQDLAYFSQIFYTTLHGRLFQGNFYQDLLYTRTVSSDFAGHNSPIQFVFVALYRLWPSPATNLVVRNLFMTLSAIPAYLLARVYLRPALAAAAAFLFLFVPAIFFQNLFEFYPFSLAAFFLLLSFWCFATGRLRWFVASLFALLLVREDLVFAVFFFGLLALWQHRGRVWVITPLALSILWAFLSWRVVLPHFLMGAPYRSNVCFAHLGGSGHEMLVSILRHPGSTVVTRDNLIYLKQLMGPFGWVFAWFSPAAFGAVPYLAINLLGGAGECPTTSLFSQHSVVPTVFLFVGFLWSLRAVCERARPPLARTTLAAAVLAIASALTLADLAFATYPEQFHELAANPIRNEVSQLRSLLPPQAPVAVPRYMAPLFANRMALYMTDDLLDYHHPDPEYIIVDRDYSRMRRQPKWRSMYDRVNTELSTRPDMIVIYQSANYIVYRHAGSRTLLPAATLPIAVETGQTK